MTPLMWRHSDSNVFLSLDTDPHGTLSIFRLRSVVLDEHTGPSGPVQLAHACLVLELQFSAVNINDLSENLKLEPATTFIVGSKTVVPLHTKVTDAIKKTFEGFVVPEWST